MRPSLLIAALAGALAVALDAPASAQVASELFAGFQTRSKDPVQIDAESLEVFEEGKQRISVFSGGVIVKRGKTTLKAARIKLYSDLEQKPASSDAFTRIEATGTVYVNSGKQTVTGAEALVDMKTQTITLSGNVVLTQGTSVMTGDQLIVYLKTGRANLSSKKRIKGVLTPEGVKAIGKPVTPPATP